MGAPEADAVMRAYLAKLRVEIAALRQRLGTPEPRNTHAKN